MKRSILALTISLLAGGCVVDPGPPRPRRVYVETAPPPEPGEIAPGPRPGYVWVPGRYVYERRGYAWVPGHWAVVQPGRVYEPGHWERGPRGYIWVEDRWR